MVTAYKSTALTFLCRLARTENSRARPVSARAESLTAISLTLLRSIPTVWTG